MNSTYPIENNTPSFDNELLYAIVIKLTTTINDVIWLVPFVVNPRSKSKVILNCSIYAWVSAFQAMLALSISHGGLAAIDALKSTDSGWSSEKVLTFFSGLSLIIYGFSICKEYFKTEYANIFKVEDNSKDEEKMLLVIAENSPDTSDAKERSSRSLFVVAFLFSLDDLSLLVSVLIGNPMTWFELTLGTIISVCVICIVCFIVGMFKSVSVFLESIPTFAIVFVFGITLAIKSLIMT